MHVITSPMWTSGHEVGRWKWPKAWVPWGCWIRGGWGATLLVVCNKSAESLALVSSVVVQSTVCIVTNTQHIVLLCGAGGIETSATKLMFLLVAVLWILKQFVLWHMESHSLLWAPTGLQHGNLVLAWSSPMESCYSLISSSRLGFFPEME